MYLSEVPHGCQTGEKIWALTDELGGDMKHMDT